MNEEATAEPAAPPPSATDAPLPLPSWRLVLALSLPVLMTQGLTFVVLMSDRFLAGHMRGSNQTSMQAAQTTAHYLSWFISCYSVLVTVGSTALVARAVGAGDRRLAVEATHQSLILAVVLGLLAMTWAFLGGIRWTVESLNLSGEAADYATNYALIMFGLLIFQTVEVAGIACLVGAGDTRTGLWVMIGIAVLNVPLAWGFSRGYWILPDLGFIGIALGTALSHVLGGIVVSLVLIRGRHGLKLELPLFWPRPDLLYRLLRISVPSGFDSMTIVAGQFWFLAIVNTFGNEASSAHGIALVWEALGYLSGAAFGTAAMTLVGQNLGAQRPQEASRAGWRAFFLGLIVMSFMGATFFLLAEPMFWLFCPDDSQHKIIEQGVPVLRLVSFAMPPLAAAIVFSNALRGAGDTRVPVVFTLIGFFLVRIPLAYYLAMDSFSFGIPYGWDDRGEFGGVMKIEIGPFSGLDMALYGCWLAMTADIGVRGLFFLARFAHGAWRKQRV